MGMPISLWQWLLLRRNITVFHKLFLKDSGLLSLYLGLYAWRIRVRYHEPAEWIGTDSVEKVPFSAAHVHAKTAFWKSSTLESVFEKFRFHWSFSSDPYRKSCVFESERILVDRAWVSRIGLFMKMTRQYLSDWIKSKHCNSSQNHWLKTYSW